MPRRFPVIAVGYAIFLGILGSNVPSPLYVLYQERFHFSAFVVTAIFATYAVGVLVALLVVGRASDVLGRRQVLVPAMALLTVSTAIFALASGVGWLLVARAVQGFAVGSLTPAAIAALVDLDQTEGGHRGPLTSGLAFISGAAVGVLLSGTMAEYLPRPTVLPFVVELGLDLSGLACLLILPAGALRGRNGARWRMQRPSVPTAVRPVFLAAALSVAVSWSVGSIYGSLNSSMLHDLLHLDSPLAAGAVLFVFNVVSGLSQAGGRQVDQRRLMQIGIVLTLVGLGLLQLAFSSGSLALFVGATIIIGIGNGLCFVGALTLVNMAAPADHRAEVNTAYSIVSYCALSIPAVGVGLATGVIGLRAAAGVFSGAIAVLALGTLVLLGRSDPARATAARAWSPSTGAARSGAARSDASVLRAQVDVVVAAGEEA
jgi:MFS family permease